MSEITSPNATSPDTPERGGGVSRRHFLDYMLGACMALTGAVAGWIALSFMRAPSAASEDSAVDVGPADEFAAGTGRVVAVGETNVIVVNQGDDGGFVAYSAICTHLGCVVAWDPERSQIVCPCHGAYFDLQGNVVSGPAPAPLPPFGVSVEGGNVVVGRV